MKTYRNKNIYLLSYSQAAMSSLKWQHRDSSLYFYAHFNVLFDFNSFQSIVVATTTVLELVIWQSTTTSWWCGCRAAAGHIHRGYWKGRPTSHAMGGDGKTFRRIHSLPLALVKQMVQTQVTLAVTDSEECCNNAPCHFTACYHLTTKFHPSKTLIGSW